MIDVAALAKRDAFTRGLGIEFVEASLGRAVTRSRSRSAISTSTASAMAA
jgi:hypothetical protein